MIHFELTFVYGVRFILGGGSFLPVGSNCCSTICRKGHPSSIELFLYLFQKPVGDIYVGLLLGSLSHFSASCVSVLCPNPPVLVTTASQRIFIASRVIPPTLCFFFKIFFLVLLGSAFHVF